MKKYSKTLNLPKMKIHLHTDRSRIEKNLLDKWSSINLYEKILKEKRKNVVFRIPDGPPYANGHIHYGHILNKVLKDIIVKYKTMTGFKVTFTPGWDCHGLPIELATERLLKDKKSKVSNVEFRKKCKNYAINFIKIQKEEFIRLGIFGDWNSPYTTLNPKYEASVIRAIAFFFKEGYIYRDRKPVHWCTSCKTALAEAEVEYRDCISHSIYVAMILSNSSEIFSSFEHFKNRRIILPIWTTTPWTLPSNLAIALGNEISYCAILDGSNNVFIVAKDLLKSFKLSTNIDGNVISIERDILKKMDGEKYIHPFLENSSDSNSFRICFADFITTDHGTGIVHIAPGHGIDDYKVGITNGLKVYSPVSDDGCFTPDVKMWGGKKVLESNNDIINVLKNKGVLLNVKNDDLITHSHAHCWRCKEQTLFRATNQWFLNMDHNDLRNKVLSEIDNTAWFPTFGRNRLSGMIKNRPDWVLSRQRIWGIPIPVYYCESCNTPMENYKIIESFADKVEKYGSDWWWIGDPISLVTKKNIVCSNCLNSSFRIGKDIIDVWFEAGLSWKAVNEKDSLDKQDIYLEGSDQHRGWFQSSIITSVAMKKEAPFKAVLTHGFVLDNNGKPYSKSAIEEARRQKKKIKYISPSELIKSEGAEILRLWVASADFKHDIVLSEDNLSRIKNEYLKLRNILRFLSGNLFDYNNNSNYDLLIKKYDLYMLYRLENFTSYVHSSYASYEFHQVYHKIFTFCTNELSAHYLDVVKNRLYVTESNSPTRRGAQKVIYKIVRNLILLLAPILSFTADEIWQYIRDKDKDYENVHLCNMSNDIFFDENDKITDKVIKECEILYNYRDLSQKDIDIFRSSKNSVLDACVKIYPKIEDRVVLLDNLDELTDIMTVSSVILSNKNEKYPKFDITLAEGMRCSRCWKRIVDINEEGLCEMCSKIIQNI